MTLRDKLKFWILLCNYVEKVVSGTSPLTLDDAIADSLFYVKAFGGTEQRNLPDGYLQRQFIYMMDESYLLTDLVPTYDCKIEMDFQTTAVPSGVFGGILGGRTITYGGLQVLTNFSSGAFMVDAFGTGSADRYTSTVIAQNNTRYKFTFDNKVATLESGGSVLFTNTFTGTGSTGAALAINAVNDGTIGAISNNNMGIYLYSFKMWDNQGNLIADYVPAVQKGAVPVVGFYDTVSKTFKTATAGTFAAGGEAVPTPDTPMDIVSNNGVLKARHASGLPLGYTLLDYIESSGTQYIDLGVNTLLGTSAFVVSSNVATTNDSSLGTFFGNKPTLSSSTGFAVYYNLPVANKLLYARNREDGVIATGFYDGNFHSVDATYDGNGTGKIIIDGVEYTASSSLPTTTVENGNNYLLFKCVNANYYYQGKTKEVRITVGGDLKFCLVPCKNASNVIGMYDTVSGQFFTNAGTGDFVAGNTVSDPVEIYADGTVEKIQITKLPAGYVELDYIASTGTQYIDTGVVPTLDYEFEIKAVKQQNRSLIGSGDDEFVLTGSSANNYAYIGSTATNLPNTIDSSVVHIWAIKNNKLYCDTTSADITKGASVPTVSLYLFARNESGTASNIGSHKMYYAKIWNDSGVLVFNGVPARRQSDNKVGMYDTVSETFFTNAGTGAFVAGAEVNTATAEMLLSLGDYTDEQEIISGVVTRKLGVAVLDGTETWTKNSAGIFTCADIINGVSKQDGYCTHFKKVADTTAFSDMTVGTYRLHSSNGSTLYFSYDASATVSDWTTWLADQYAAGTPVIIVYPLATETTDTVTGQPMNTTAGDNILEITQASLNNLELEAKYKQSK